MQHINNAEDLSIVELNTSKLTSGMVLAKPIYTRSGLLMLNKDSELTDRLIDRLQQLEQHEDSTLVVYVHESL